MQPRAGVDGAKSAQIADAAELKTMAVMQHVSSTVIYMHFAFAPAINTTRAAIDKNTKTLPPRRAQPQ